MPPARWMWAPTAQGSGSARHAEASAACLQPLVVSQLRAVAAQGGSSAAKVAREQERPQLLLRSRDDLLVYMVQCGESLFGGTRAGARRAN